MTDKEIINNPKVVLSLKRTNEVIRGDKRQHFPYVAESECPKCGSVCVVDLRREYLGYPNFGELTEINFYCANEEEDCDVEWSVPVIPRLVLELVE